MSSDSTQSSTASEEQASEMKQDKVIQVGNSSTHSSQQLEQNLWQQFARAQNAADYFRSWLALQCSQLEQCTRGVLVLGAPDTGPFAPAAYWPPEQGGSSALGSVAEQALTQSHGMVVKYDVPGTQQIVARHGIAFPIHIDRHLYGVVAVEVTPRSHNELQSTMRQLQWACGWVEAWFRRQQANSDGDIRQRLIAALDLVAASLEHEHFGSAAKNFVTELATQLDCERVSLGFLRGKHGRHVQIVALSHSAQFGKQMNLTRSISAAMDEAMDQQTVIHYPVSEDTKSELEINYITREHEALATQHGAGTIVTIPLFRNGRVYAALCLERPKDKVFDTPTIELCRSVASVVGPVLQEKRSNDRWLIVKIAESFKNQLTRLLGPDYFVRKLVALGVLAIVVFFYQATGTFTIKAETVLEGAIQRVIVAPFDGYIANASMRAGDVVVEGDVLASLDDRELKLERLKWSSQKAQLNKQYDEALAKRDRAQINIVNAQIEQANAQLALIDDQLSRTQMSAPFAGFIISGDLSQSLGASVRRGDEMFVIAPLSEYRVILKVKERDIQEVHEGQMGDLVLASMTEDKFGFTVKRITPVTTAAEGQNYFRVEAEFTDAPQHQDSGMQLLRPGMEGVGKIKIDERRLIAIWTRNLIDWMRMWLWRWMP